MAPPTTITSIACSLPPIGHGRRRAMARLWQSRLAMRTSRKDGHSLRRDLRVFDGFKRRKLHVVKLAIHLLDLADVDVVDHVPALCIDRHRTAGAFPRHALHALDHPFALGCASC